MLEDLIWQAMLTADMNARYWGYMARRYTRWDKGTKFLLAFTASGTVASWGIWKEIEIIWKILSGLSAVVAIALPILDWSKNVEKMSALNGEWIQLHNEYQFLLLKLDATPDDPEVRGKFEQLKKQEASSGTLDSTLPDNKKLLSRCQIEVLQTMGIQADHQEG